MKHLLKMSDLTPGEVTHILGRTKHKLLQGKLWKITLQKNSKTLLRSQHLPTR